MRLIAVPPIERDVSQIGRLASPNVTNNLPESQHASEDFGSYADLVFEL